MAGAAKMAKERSRQGPGEAAVGRARWTAADGRKERSWPKTLNTQRRTDGLDGIGAGDRDGETGNEEKTRP